MLHRSKTIDFDTFKKYVEDLATSKKMNLDEIYDKLIGCGVPGTAGTTVRSVDIHLIVWSYIPYLLLN